MTSRRVVVVGICVFAITILTAVGLAMATPVAGTDTTAPFEEPELVAGGTDVSEHTGSTPVLPASTELLATAQLTLVTGERIEITEADGQLRVELSDSSGSYTTFETDNGVYVFPDAYDPDRHDRELFNLTRLIEYDYGTGPDGTVPVIIELSPTVGPAALDPVASGLTNVTEFDLIDAASAEFTPASLDDDGMTPATMTAAGIESITLDRPVEITLNGSIEEIGAHQAWEDLDGTGYGVNISIIDTGIDADHPDFEDRVIYEEDFTDEGTTEDLNGHGTHVAGIAAGNGTVSDGNFTGVAPEATVFDMRALGADGSGSISDVIEAVERSVELDADVISMSLGASVPPDSPEAEVIAEATAAGVIVVAAAGNNGPDRHSVAFPANAPTAISVGADDTLDRWYEGDLAEFSSRGPTLTGHVGVDVTAPGVGITAAGSQDADEFPHTSKSGTSMAAPHVGGLAALLVENDPEISPEAARGQLVSTAESLETDYANESLLAVVDAGAGQVNATAALDPSFVIVGSSLGFDFDKKDFGETRSATVTLINHEAEPITVTLAPNVTSLDGDTPGDISLNRSELTIEPGESADVLVTVNASAAEVGWYGGSIELDADGFEAPILVGYHQPPPTDELIKITKLPIDDRDVAGERVGVADVDGEDVRVGDMLTFDENGTTYFHPQTNATYTVITGGVLENDSYGYSALLGTVIEEPFETSEIVFDEADTVAYEYDLEAIEAVRGPLRTEKFNGKLATTLPEVDDIEGTPTMSMSFTAVGGAATNLEAYKILMDGPAPDEQGDDEGLSYELRQIAHPNDTHEQLENWGIQNERVYDLLTWTDGVDGPVSKAYTEAELRAVDIELNHDDPDVLFEEDGVLTNRSVYRLLHTFEPNTDFGIDSGAVLVRHLELGEQQRLRYYHTTDGVASGHSIRADYRNTKYDHGGYRFNGPLVREPAADNASLLFNRHPLTPAIFEEANVSLLSTSAIEPDEATHINETAIVQSARIFTDVPGYDDRPHGLFVWAEPTEQPGYRVSVNGDVIEDDTANSLTAYFVDIELDDHLEAGDLVDIHATAAIEPLGHHETSYSVVFDPDGENTPPEIASMEVIDLNEHSTGVAGPVTAVVDITDHVTGEPADVTAYFASGSVNESPFDGGEGWTEANIEKGDDGRYFVHAEVDRSERSLSLAVSATDAEGSTVEHTTYDVGHWLEPDGFVVASVDIPGAIEPDHPFDITVEILNQQPAIDEQPVTIYLDDVRIHEETLNLTSAETGLVETDHVIDERGDYELTVTTGDDSFSQSITVGDAAEYEIVELDLNEQLGNEDTIDVGVTIENTGDLAGQQTVELYFDHQLMDAYEGLTIEGGETQTIHLEGTVHGEIGDSINISVHTDDDIEYQSATIVEGAYFAVDVLEDPVLVGEGDVAKVPVHIENVGEATVTRSVELKLRDSLTTVAKEVQLAGGESTDITIPLDTASLDRGVHNATVTTGDDIQVVAIEVVTPANYSIEGPDEPVEAAESTVAEIPMSVTNVGEAPGNQSIAFALDGEVVATIDAVELDPGESTDLLLEVPTDTIDIGLHQGTIMSDDDNASAVIEVVAASVALSFSEVTIEPSPVDPGEAITVTVTIENAGTIPGDVAVQALIDEGFDEDSAEITVDPSDSTSVTLTLSPPAEPGQYAIEVTATGIDDAETETVTVEETPTPTPTPADGTPGFGVVIGILAIAGVLVLLGRWRNRGTAR